MDHSVLEEIAHLKLGALAKRLDEAHGTQTVFTDELVKELVKRCTEGETCARALDHALRGSLMPVLAKGILAPEDGVLLRGLAQHAVHEGRDLGRNGRCVQHAPAVHGRGHGGRGQRHHRHPLVERLDQRHAEPLVLARAEK